MCLHKRADHASAQMALLVRSGEEGARHGWRRNDERESGRVAVEGSGKRAKPAVGSEKKERQEPPLCVLHLSA